MVSRQQNMIPFKHPADRARNRGASNRASTSLALLTENVMIPRKVVLQATTSLENEQVKISLHFTEIIGKGTFGQIEKATLNVVLDDKAPQTSSKPGDSGPLQVAVKRVLQDPRYKNRELGIMQKLGYHPNIVRFYYYYYTSSSPNLRSSSTANVNETAGGVQLYLHLILECFPGSLCDLIYQYSQHGTSIPVFTVKLFTYQMLKALAYLHSHRICHRDIKSSNLLVNERTLVLKVCDFGSAKEMSPGTPNVSYISSRYYRAPELLFGAQSYTCAIDTWSAGCVLAEMLRQNCLFTGNDSVDQLVKVIRVLGTPTADDIASMNPVYESYCFPDVRSCPVKLFFPHGTPADMLSLMSLMLVYNPSKRILPKDALQHLCFDSLKEASGDAEAASAGGSASSSNANLPAGLFDPNPPTPPHSVDPGFQPAKKVVSPSASSASTAKDDKKQQQLNSNHSKQSNDAPNKKSDGTSTEPQQGESNSIAKETTGEVINSSDSSSTVAATAAAVPAEGELA